MVNDFRHKLVKVDKECLNSNDANNDVLICKAKETV